MKIGTVQLENPTIFAPLAGISNLPMRLLARQAGAALVCSEMISANGLVYGAAKTHQLLASTPEEKPLSVQIFGSDPAILAEAACHVVQSGADILDINFGCSVKKILKSGSGAALMSDPARAEAVLTAIRKAVAIPLTIKIRSGWDPSGDEAEHLSRIAQQCGVDAVAVHPRTARQGFSGRADWSLTARIKKALSIPVIGSGDVRSADDALRLLNETGCDAVMVGRAAIGNPFIFTQILDRLAGRPETSPTAAQRLAAMESFFNDSVRYLGETRACFMMRSRLNWFVKGLPNAAHFRKAITTVASRAQAESVIREYAAFLDQQAERGAY
jgi:tRNA-dihydrouridine synthase B